MNEMCDNAITHNDMQWEIVYLYLSHAGLTVKYLMMNEPAVTGVAHFCGYLSNQ